MKELTSKKGGFSSGLGFILASAGSAIGLGNLWGFPFKTAQNGGAAFVFIYVACVIFIGSITMICEIFLGKRAQANPISAFKKIGKNLGWIGVVAIFVPTVIVCYYSVLGGYTVTFTANAFTGNAGKLGEYSSSAWMIILFSAVFIAFALAVVMAGIKGGIEKASKVLMPMLFILLLAVVIFVLCLGEGVKEGVAYYLIPDFSKVTFGSVLSAMGQAFYSLSLGMGTMIVYGSYTDKEINIVKSTGLICIFDTLVALLAGLAIFPAVFHFSSVEGVDVSTLNLNGMMLMFETLPKVFESIGFLGNIIEFVFFAMVVIAAVTSVISILEVSSQFVIQAFKGSRKRTTVVVALGTFALSIPIGISLGHSLNGVAKMTVFGLDWLSFLDVMTNTILMPVCALLSCVAVGWFIGVPRTMAELNADGTSFGRLQKAVGVMIKYVVPVLIAVIEVFGLKDLVVPNGVFSGNGLGIALTAYSLFGVLIAVYFLFFKNREMGTNADEMDINKI